MHASPTARGRATRSFGVLWRPLLRRLSRVLAQSQTDAERLLAIGCRPERVTVAGNLKFDVRAAQEAEATRHVEGDLRGLAARGRGQHA